MKHTWEKILLAVLTVIVYPGLILALAPEKALYTSDVPTAATEPVPTVATEPVPTAAADNPTVKVLQSDGSVQELDLEQYVLRVVLGEMPAEFEPEALKAQAVASRTYTLRHTRVSPKHNDNAVCTDSTCCQAYCTEEAFLRRGETDRSLEKIRAAVTATAGEVLTYGGTVIEATYFSCSGGRTEDAAAVWGADIPYLQSVSSPGEENAAHNSDTVTFTVGEFTKKLGVSSPAVTSVTYTEGGGIATAVIGGKSFSGTVLRQKLGLRSTACSISLTGDTVTATTHGYGHRVGMSQYGADAMAVNGSNYREILGHYYTGSAITEIP